MVEDADADADADAFLSSFPLKRTWLRRYRVIGIARNRPCTPAKCSAVTKAVYWTYKRKHANNEER